MSTILCLDIGGTNTRIGHIAVDGDSPVPSPGTGPVTFPTPQFLGDLRQLIHKHRAGPIRGISAAVAGPIQNHRVVRIAPNVAIFHGRIDVDFAKELEESFGIPAIVVNDMEAALAGEVAEGKLRGCRWAFLDTISSGWGGAMLYNGIEVAAEPGHVWLGSLDEKCGCGRRGCAERRYSGGAIQKRILREVALTADARGDSSYRIPHGMDPCAFADAEYRRQEPWVCLLYHDVACAIGELWGNRLNLCPLIEKIVYQGMFAVRYFALPKILESVRRRMLERSLFPDQHEKITIEQADAPHGALLGAARIFLRERAKKP